MPTFTQSDPNTPAVVAEGNQSLVGGPPSGVIIKHGAGLRADGIGRGVQGVQATSQQDAAIVAVVPKGTAIHALAGPNPNPVGDGFSTPGTGVVFTQATDIAEIPLWVRHNSGRRAAMFEGSLQVFNADPAGLDPDTGVLFVRAAGASTAIRANSEPPGRALGCLAASTDPTFRSPTGVYGESQNQGVVGVSKGNLGSGVLGSASQSGADLDPAKGGTGVLGTGYIGVRGETQTGVAILARTFPPGGQAARFEGNVKVTGNHECGGDLTVDRNFTVNGSLKCGGDHTVAGNFSVNGSLVGTLKIAGNGDIQFADC